MLNKKMSLILLAAAAVVELTSLVWIRGEYRSTMIDGAEYQVPAAIDFKGDFYEEDHLAHLREELVQVAAVAVHIIEKIDNDDWVRGKGR